MTSSSPSQPSEFVVSCSGDAESPHPKVYVRVKPPQPAYCPYCGKNLTPKPS